IVSITVVDTSTPVAGPQALNTDQNTAIAGTLTATDADGDTLTFAVTGGPSHGVLTSFDPATGAFTYTPNTNYHGPDSFAFTASDGSNTSAAATVSITVVDTSTPVANAQALSTDQNTARAGTLTATDSDGDTPSYALVGGPLHGSLSSFNPAT